MIVARPVDALFPGRREALAAGRCYRCAAAVDPDSFTDETARSEYRLSAMCEPCQVVVFSALARMEEGCE